LESREKLEDKYEETIAQIKMHLDNAEEIEDLDAF
jgi:hypothetical protein